jgi:hypothetical protein
MVVMVLCRLEQQMLTQWGVADLGMDLDQGSQLSPNQTVSADML